MKICNFLFENNKKRGNWRKNLNALRCFLCSEPNLNVYGRRRRRFRINLRIENNGIFRQSTKYRPPIPWYLTKSGKKNEKVFATKRMKKFKNLPLKVSIKFRPIAMERRRRPKTYRYLNKTIVFR